MLWSRRATGSHQARSLLDTESATVEDEIAGSLEKSVGQHPDAVECPGDLSARQGDYKLDVKVDG